MFFRFKQLVIAAEAWLALLITVIFYVFLASELQQAFFQG
jgi:hypothetical protein